MIAFATLFLGLILGVQEVELIVGEDVASVEVLLNGFTMGVLAEEPWKLRCDFGDELEPQELVAVARDAENNEIGRVRQWINLPQPPARVTVALDGGDGRPRVARLSWESRAGARPQSFEVSFDGTPLEVDDPRYIVLPPHDDRQLHFLRAELEFSDHVASVAEVAFGGTYADQVSTELTAVPVTAKKSRIKKDGALDGLVWKRGEPLEVVAVEKGAAQVVVVPDAGALEALYELSRFQVRPARSFAEAAIKLRHWAAFGRKQFVRFLWPVVRHQEGRTQKYDLFPTSYEYGPGAGGLYYLLFLASPDLAALERNAGAARLADAAAVAGLHAAEQRQRRAVVLLLADPAKADPSQLAPLQARRYLERLRVPFEVWSLAGATGGQAWGEVVDVSSLTNLRQAVEKLSKIVDRQWLVWVDGIHLPQEVVLAPEAVGIELVR